MKRTFVACVAVTVFSGCATVVASRIVDPPGSRAAMERVAEGLYGGGLLEALTAAEVEAVRGDVGLRATLVGPADRAFRGLTLAALEDAPFDDDSPLTQARVSVRGMGEVVHRFIEFRGAPADPSRPVRGTVVLLHALGTDRFQMMPWALELGDHGWRSLLVDLRGHGRSDGLRSWGVEDGADIAALVDALAERGLLVRPLVAVGASYGGAAALRWAAADARVDAVVTIGAFVNAADAVRNGASEASPLLARLAGRRGIAAGLARAGKRLGSDLDDASAALEAASRLDGRLLVFHAGDDRIVPLDHAHRLHAAAPRSVLSVKEGVGHVELALRQELVMPEMLEWLDRIAPSRDAHDSRHDLDGVPGDADAVAGDPAPDLPSTP